MKFRPIDENILVQPDEAKSQTEGGILLPETAKEQPRRGTVLAIGPKVEAVSVGDRVWYKSFAGYELTEEYRVMRPDDLLGVEEEEKEPSRLDEIVETFLCASEN